VEVLFNVSTVAGPLRCTSPNTDPPLGRTKEPWKDEAFFLALIISVPSITYRMFYDAPSARFIFFLSAYGIQLCEYRLAESHHTNDLQYPERSGRSG